MASNSNTFYTNILNTNDPTVQLELTKRVDSIISRVFLQSILRSKRWNRKTVMSPDLNPCDTSAVKQQMKKTQFSTMLKAFLEKNQLTETKFANGVKQELLLQTDRALQALRAKLEGKDTQEQLTILSNDINVQDVPVVNGERFPVKPAVTGMLKGNHIDANSSEKAKLRLGDITSRLMNILTKRLATTQAKTIDSRDVLLEIQQWLPEPYKGKAVEHAKLALTRYHEAKADKTKRNLSRSRKAQLSISVSACENYLRKAVSPKKLRKQVPVCMAGALEGFLAELLKTTAEIMRPTKKKTITPEFIDQTVKLSTILDSVVGIAD
jgi:histone H3/H4